MSALVPLLIALLRALIPALVKESKDTAEDASPAIDVRDRLRERVRASWNKAARSSLLVICLLVLPGCFTRTVYVPDGTPVRLRETIKKAKVWVLDKDGKPIPSKMDLPEGWYTLPDPGPGLATDSDESRSSPSVQREEAP